MGNKRTNLIKKPFGIVIKVAALTTGIVKIPTGWVIEDLSFSGFTGLDVNVSASTDVNATTVQPYTDTDLDGNFLPFSFDFNNAASSFFPSGAMVIDWKNIGMSELRSIQVYNNSAWSENSILIWGCLIADPRCFVG